MTLNGLRKVRRRNEREIGLDDFTAAGSTRPEAEPDLKTRLNQAIDDLPEGYRVVFIMHDVEGYTHEEIGASLGVSSYAPRPSCLRARARLREAAADFAKD